MRKQKERIPSIVTLAILTTITSIFWIFFSVYRLLTSKLSSEIPPSVLSPLNPSLDMSTLEVAEKKVYFNEGDALSPSFQLQETVEQTTEETQEPTPISTGSGELEP